LWELTKMRRYSLCDDQGAGSSSEWSVGMTAADNRLFVEAVLYPCRARIPWRDLPERFGDWNNIHRRFSRWAKFGVRKRFSRCLAEDAGSVLRGNPPFCGIRGLNDPAVEQPWGCHCGAIDTWGPRRGELFASVGQELPEAACEKPASGPKLPPESRCS
jgi:transposase